MRELPSVTIGDEHPELNVQLCTMQIEYVVRISGISLKKLEAVFVQGMGMKSGVNWAKFYDAFMNFVGDKESKARSLTDSCVGGNGHFISPDAKSDVKAREVGERRRHYFGTSFD
ncbi:hypothetical protein KBD71_00890 [Candidatus Woesebacteria bacterium]|nr:hypothetical protein [Candidatus Woesebacteria bacterium]